MRRSAAVAALAAALVLGACGPARADRPGAPPSATAAASAPPQPASPPAEAATASSVASEPSVSSPPPSNVPPLVATHVVTGRLQPLPTGAVAPVLTDVAFSSATAGAAVGYRCAGVPERCTGLIVATSDGGAIWAQAGTEPAALTDVRFLADGFGWAWGPSGLYATTDGGQAWHALGLPPATDVRGEPMMYASFADSAHGWAAFGGVNCATQGCPIAVFRTDDGGAHWSPVADNSAPGAPQNGLPKPSLGWLNFEDGGYLGGGRGWLVSDTPIGDVWTTADGGRHWTAVVTLEQSGANTAAAFAPDGHGWAAGRNDTNSSLHVTLDGGTTWTDLGAVSGDIYALSAAVDGSSAWALSGPTAQPCAWGRTVCGDAVAVATGTGVGTAVPAPAGDTLHALAALSARSAWAVATGPWPGTALLQTTDAGRHWSVRYETGAAAPAGPWGFWTGHQGWAVGSVGDPVAMLRTTDGGSTWSRVADLPADSVDLAGFPTPALGFAVTGQGRLLLSRDGGRTWTAQALPRDVCTSPGSTVGFSSPQVGWIASSGGLCGSTLLRTADGGQTWHEPALLPGGLILSAAYSASGSGWAVVEPLSRSGDVLLERTSTLGTVWTPVADLGPVHWPPSGPTPAWVGATLRWDPAGGLWVDGLRSTDGGRTWTRYALASQGGSTRAPRQAQFVTGQIGWMTTAGGLYQTTDGGSTWRQVGGYGNSLPQVP